MKKIIFLGILIISQLAYASREPLPNFEINSSDGLFRVRPTTDGSHLVIHLQTPFYKDSLDRQLRRLGYPILVDETVSIRIPTGPSYAFKYENNNYLIYFDSRYATNRRKQMSLMFRTEKGENYYIEEKNHLKIVLGTTYVTRKDSGLIIIFGRPTPIEHEVKVFLKVEFYDEENEKHRKLILDKSFFLRYEYDKVQP